MCGFGVYKSKFNPYFIQKRGQDMTSTVGWNGFNFTHFLLSITGDKTPQPFIDEDNDVLAVYNGEIYNHPFVRSDGENIIPLYKEHGWNFPKHLDGEFAIALYDFRLGIAIFATDPFGTKPIWVNGVECASYQSGLGGSKVEANSIVVKNLYTGDVENIDFTYSFDFHNQIETSYDKCITAFEEAIRKRSKHRCFIGLSSGYDSGAIACELDKQGVDFKAYMIVASEDQYTLWMRQKYLKDVHIVHAFDHAVESKHLNDNAEEFFYNYYYGDTHMNGSYKNDWAARGLSHICRLGSAERRNVYLSGTGADEILSDYSLIPKQSQFKGKFPDSLFKWTNFHDGCQYSYLGKEECVAGSWNIETRYPFLDKQFVQEFLYLTPELKNRKYKAVLHEYLTRNSFPFKKNSKIGFCV